MVTKNISFCDKRHSDVFVVQHVSGIFSGICSDAWLMLKQKFQCSFFCHPSLGSRLGTKLVNTKALYNVFDGTVQKDWIPVSATCMTPICSYSCFSRLPYFATHLNRYPFWRDTNNSCERDKFSPYTFQA